MASGYDFRGANRKRCWKPTPDPFHTCINDELEQCRRGTIPIAWALNVRKICTTRHNDSVSERQRFETTAFRMRDKKDGANPAYDKKRATFSPHESDLVHDYQLGMRL